MPFKHFPQANIHHWKPDNDEFDQQEDRLLAETNWGDMIVLAWSTDERSTGGLIVAPEAIPSNVANHFGDKLDPVEYALEEFMQPLLFVTQLDDNRLSLELTQPHYQGSFETSGQVCEVRPVAKGHSYTDDLPGHRRPIMERDRRAS